MALLKEELAGKYITFIFDGTTRLGEAVNVVYRFCTEDFSKNELRLIDFTTTQKHMSGHQLGRHLIEVLTRKARIPDSFIVRDTCATNGAALRVIQPFMPGMMGLLCYSHMLQGTGSRFGFKQLDKLMTPFLAIQLMALVKSIWKEIMEGLI